MSEKLQKYFDENVQPKRKRIPAQDFDVLKACYVDALPFKGMLKVCSSLSVSEASKRVKQVLRDYALEERSAVDKYALFNQPGSVRPRRKTAKLEATPSCG